MPGPAGKIIGSVAGGLASKVGGKLFGGGGGGGSSVSSYNVPGTSEISRGALEGVLRRAGITGVEDYFAGKPGAELDFSKVGAGPSEEDLAGFAQRLSPLRSAADRISGMSYDPAAFSFEGLPKEFGDLAFSQGARNITDASQDQMRRTREALGTRRPDLLFRAEEEGGRAANRQIGDLGSDIALNVMDKGTDLAVKQQLAQAAENLGASEFNLGVGRDLFGAESDIYGKDVDLREEQMRPYYDLLALYPELNQIQASGRMAVPQPGESSFMKQFGGGLGDIAAKGAGSIFGKVFG